MIDKRTLQFLFYYVNFSKKQIHHLRAAFRAFFLIHGRYPIVGRGAPVFGGFCLPFEAAVEHGFCDHPIGEIGDVGAEDEFGARF